MGFHFHLRGTGERDFDAEKEAARERIRLKEAEDYAKQVADYNQKVFNEAASENEVADHTKKILDYAKERRDAQSEQIATRWSTDGTPGYKTCQIVNPKGETIGGDCTFGNDVQHVDGILYGASLAPTKGSYTLNGKKFEFGDTIAGFNPSDELDGDGNRTPIHHKYLYAGDADGKKMLCELESKKQTTANADHEDVSNIIRCGTKSEWEVEEDDDRLQESWYTANGGSTTGTVNIESTLW